MAIWQFTKAGAPTADPQFDDGLPQRPGEAGFDETAVKARASSLGADGYNYLGETQAA